jgi:sulfite reductase beta subunit-like hemoprotein
MITETQSNPGLPVEVAAVCAADICRFEEETAAFKAGTLPLAEYKGLRAKHGSYEQRQDGRFMVRPRTVAGVLTPAVARVMAELSSTFGDKVVHLTTRQAVQIHGVEEAQVPEVMRRLLAAGVPSTSSGGNAPRNVATCPLAGVCPHEHFDVTPHAQRLGEHLLAVTGHYRLPRKFKSAISGCDRDCALAAITDMGLVAQVREGRPGFALWAGGKLGAVSLPGHPLEWIPAEEILTAAAALLTILERHGDHQNRARARLGFVFERLGVPAVLDELRREMQAHPVPAGNLPVAAEASPVAVPTQDPWRLPVVDPASGLQIIRQKQPGVVAVCVSPPLGLLPAAELLRVAEAAECFSQEKSLRLTSTQGLLLRSVPADRLVELAGFLGNQPPAIPLIVCSGTTICRLGSLDSRAFARDLAAGLAAAGISEACIREADIRISGCGNSCGQSPIAGIGLVGAPKTQDGKLVPHYRILIGGRTGAGQVRLGETMATLPATEIPAALARFLQAWQAERHPGEPIAAFADRTHKGIGPIAQS